MESENNMILYKKCNIFRLTEKIYLSFQLIKEVKTNLISHLRDVNKILELVSKEPWVYDYPEHVKEFKNLKASLKEESVKETYYITSLVNLTCNLNKAIEIIKNL